MHALLLSQVVGPEAFVPARVRASSDSLTRTPLRASSLWNKLGRNDVAVKSHWRRIPTVEHIAYICGFLTAFYVLASDLLGSAAYIPRIAFLMYFVLTAGEWAIHKFLMHGIGLPDALRSFTTSHLDHHRSVQRDMTLSDHDTLEVYFSYFTTLGTFMALWEVTTLLGWLLGWTPLSAWAVVPSLLAALAHNAYWNKLHPEFHCAVDDTWSPRRGMPYIDVLPTRNAVGDWLLECHAGHHAVGGVGNYNVVVPGFDHIAGTYYYRCDGD